MTTKEKEVKIQKATKVPTTSRGRELKYPFGELSKCTVDPKTKELSGDWFFIESKTTSAIAATKSNASKKFGRKFISRNVTFENKEGVGIWYERDLTDEEKADIAKKEQEKAKASKK